MERDEMSNGNASKQTKNAKTKKLTQSIALSAVEFVYLFLSLVFIWPKNYLLENPNGGDSSYSTGFGAATIVYAFGILYPLVTRFLKGEVSANKRIRKANIAILSLAFLSICTCVIYMNIWKNEMLVWLTYGLAVFTAAPSLFSFVVSAREYINEEN